jgi:hypothetical protein
MDIHRGQALTTPDGTALDVFQFTDAEHFLRQNAEAVGEINQVLDGVVAGAFDVSRLLGGRLRRRARAGSVRRIARARQQRALAEITRWSRSSRRMRPGCSIASAAPCPMPGVKWTSC